MALNQKYIYAYTCVSSIIAILIFIYGSIPKNLSESKFSDKNDLPTTIDNVKITPQKFYHSHVENLILFVIDGFGMEDLEENFDYVSKLIKEGDACFLTYKNQPLSTTLRKIKTLSSGRSSGFAESLLRLGNNKFPVDNIFRLAKGENLKISFHGLNSWYELFPDYINMETLENVENSHDNFTMETKMALTSDLLKDHWDWFIFHYQVSKNSELLFPSEKVSKIKNLRYLNEIVKYIHELLEYTIEHYTILILGDSGTRNLRSPNEFQKDPNFLAPYIVIQREPCLFHIHNSYKKPLNEFDIAPMISVLTGLPIPSSSYGSIHLNLLFDFTVDEKMYVSYYNTKKLIDEFIKLGATSFIKSIRSNFQKIVSEHGVYLQSLEKNETFSTKILDEYENIMHSLSEEIDDIRFQPNVSIQFLAFILLIEAIAILLNAPSENTKNLCRNIMIALGFNAFLLAFILGLGTSKRVTSFIYMSQDEGIIVAMIMAIMIWNSFIIVRQKMFISIACSALISKARKSVEKVETLSSIVDDQPTYSNKSSIFLIFILGTILQSLSLLEFSFVKCEKWTWFFLWASTCFWIIIKKVQKIYLVAFSTNANDQEEFRNSEGQILILFSVLIMHRIILSYTEIEHWLQHSNNSIWNSFCLFFGLLILAFVCNIFYEPFSNKLEKLIICTQLTLTACAIFASKVAAGKATFFYYPPSSGKIESILFWIGYTFGLVYGLVISAIKTCFNGKSGAKELLASGITCCTMLMASQTTTPHVILISIQILYSMTLTDVLHNYYRSYILSHVWLGHLFFQYQQNYVLSLDNMEQTIGIFYSLDYHCILDGFLKILNIFSAPILSYFLCIHGLLSNNSKTRASENVARINKIYLCCQLMIIINYVLGMMFRCQNEWPWSVLCLKFLYEVVKADLLIIISLGVQAVISLHDITLAPPISSGFP